jgi:hypothetical protein
VVRAALIVNNVAVAGAVSILAILLNGDWPTRAHDASYWLLVTSVFVLSMYFMTRRLSWDATQERSPRQWVGFFR